MQDSKIDGKVNRWMLNEREREKERKRKVIVVAFVVVVVKLLDTKLVFSRRRLQLLR